MTDENDLKSEKLNYILNYDQSKIQYNKYLGF